MNLNKIYLIGNLTRDPETRALPSGQSVTTFGIATNRTWKNQSGEKQVQAEFHNIVAFGRLAEIAQQYLTKGKMVLIEGRVQTRSWQGQDGVKRNRTEIVVEGMQLGPRGSGEQGGNFGGGNTGQPTNNTQGGDAQDEAPLETIEYPDDGAEINPDDIPF